MFRVFPLLVVIGFAMTTGAGATSREDVMAMLRKANEESRDTIRSIAMLSGTASRETARQWIDEWREEAGASKGTVQWAGKRLKQGEAGACKNDDDCSGHGTCFVGFCSAEEFTDKQSCEEASACVLRAVGMEYGKIPSENDRIYAPQFTSATECNEEGVCRSDYLKANLNGISTEQECLSAKINKYGTCIVNSRTVDEYENDKEACLADHGGICFEKSTENEILPDRARPMNKFKTKETCSEAGGLWIHNAAFNIVPNVWLKKYAWIEPIWYVHETCKCELGYAGGNCEMTDGHIFLDEWKTKHGDKAMVVNRRLINEVNYRVIKYGEKGGRTLSSHRVPVEVFYEERLARDGSLAFSSASTSQNEKGSLIVNPEAATVGWKAILDVMQEGDEVEAVLTKHNHHADGRGAICVDCYVLLTLKLLKIRDDLVIPSFEYDVEHLGDSEDQDTSTTLPHKEFKDFVESQGSSKEGQNGMVVMFYSPTCGHSRAFMPAFAKSAVKYANDLPFAAVDCLVHVQTCRENAVTGYPTIKYLREGKNLKFNDKRTEGGIDRFIDRLKAGKMVKVQKAKKEL